MAYNQTTALTILQSRLDRGGQTVPVSLEGYWKTRLDAAAAELEQKGIVLTDTVADNVLVADYAAWKIQNRDKETGEPPWLKLAIRERWLAQERDVDDS